MSARLPVVLITGRRRPHEQLLLAYSVLSGLLFLFVTSGPPSLQAALPGWGVKAWAAGLAVSGLVGLVGCWWHGERGLGLEAGGLLMNAGALLVYVVVVFSTAGLRALVPGGVLAAWAVANLWRARQVRCDLTAIRKT